MRGQLSIEFSFMVMLSMVFLAAILIVVYAYMQQANSQQSSLDLEQIAFNIQEEILLAATVRDGYERNFTIPSVAGGRPYTMTNDESLVYLDMTDTSYSVVIPEINGTFVIGLNRVTKENGIIRVNP